MSRQIIDRGLQEGDQLSIRTATGDRIQIIAKRTRGGYVKLELELPFDTQSKIIRRRDVEQVQNDDRKN